MQKFGRVMLDIVYMHVDELCPFILSNKQAKIQSPTFSHNLEAALFMICGWSKVEAGVITVYM